MRICDECFCLYDESPNDEQLKKSKDSLIPSIIAHDTVKPHIRYKVTLYTVDSKTSQMLDLCPECVYKTLLGIVASQYKETYPDASGAD